MPLISCFSGKPRSANLQSCNRVRLPSNDSFRYVCQSFLQVWNGRTTMQWSSHRRRQQPPILIVILFVHFANDNFHQFSSQFQILWYKTPSIPSVNYVSNSKTRHSFRPATPSIHRFSQRSVVVIHSLQALLISSLRLSSPRFQKMKIPQQRSRLRHSFPRH